MGKKYMVLHFIHNSDRDSRYDHISANKNLLSTCRHSPPYRCVGKMLCNKLTVNVEVVTLEKKQDVLIFVCTKTTFYPSPWKAAKEAVSVTAAFDNSEGDEEKNNKSSFYNMWGRSQSQQKKKLYSKYLNVCFLCYVSTGGPVVHPAVSAVSELKLL